MTYTTNVQYKGTDLCMDFVCMACGYQSHYDGFFASYIVCRRCRQIYKLPTDLAVTPVSASELNGATPLEDEEECDTEQVSETATATGEATTPNAEAETPTAVSPTADATGPKSSPDAPSPTPSTQDEIYCVCRDCIRCGCGRWEAHHRDIHQVTRP